MFTILTHDCIRQAQPGIIEDRAISQIAIAIFHLTAIFQYSQEYRN